MYKIIKDIIVFIVCKILFRVKYENINVVEKLDKCIICPNHSRIYDPIFLFSKIHNMYSIAKSELFKNKFVASLLTYYNVFPIKRDHADIGALKKSLKLLKEHNKIKLLVFPEGKVIKSKENRGDIKDGAIFLSLLSNVPIIPVYITSRPKYFSRVTVKFGEPFIVYPKASSDKKLLKKESKRLLDCIYSLE